MKALHKQCRKNKGDSHDSASVESKSADLSNGIHKKSGWNTYLDTNTHKGLEILAKHFDLSKKLIVRQLVSEKLRQLELDNPIKEVTLRQ